MRPQRSSIVMGVILLAAAAVLIPSRAGSPETVVKSALIMGTAVEITVRVDPPHDRAAAEEAIGKAFEEIRRVESAFSAYRPGNELSRINALGAGPRLRVSREMFDLIEKAVEYSNITDGAFDITVKPLVDLWAGSRGGGAVPSDGAVIEALGRVGSRDLILDRKGMTIAFGREGMALDLGGIAKGYATDRAIAVLKACGVGNAIVNSGGDMYCLGRHSGERKWRVGIRDPRDKEKIFMELDLQDMAVDTSGDYEKYFIAGGRRYSHIIDPRTGYPIGDAVVSASVIAGDSASADALATAACVMGRSAMNIFDAYGIDAVIVYKENGSMRVLQTDAVKARYGAAQVSDLR